jgi:ribosomal protein L32
MKSTMESNSNIKYNQDEVCPICGRYQPDGEVCKECLKQYELYKPKSHIEE